MLANSCFPIPLTPPLTAHFNDSLLIQLAILVRSTKSKTRELFLEPARSPTCNTSKVQIQSAFTLVLRLEHGGQIVRN